MVAPANNVSPMSPTAGMGGRLVSATDPEARRAKAELEGTALDKNTSADVPKRLPPQQRAAWWCMFGAFALGSAGGVFAGLAEVQEDKATRLAITLDSETGSALLYADIRAEYEDILRVGRRDAAVARGLLAAAGGFLVAGIVLFIVHAVKSRKAADHQARDRPPGPRPRRPRGPLLAMLPRLRHLALRTCPSRHLSRPHPRWPPLAACFNAPADAVLFACTPEAPDCPTDYSCADDGCCHRDGSDIAANYGACGLGGPATGPASSTDR
jgi:hypothetical protein